MQRQPFFPYLHDALQKDDALQKVAGKDRGVRLHVHLHERLRASETGREARFNTDSALRSDAGFAGSALRLDTGFALGAAHLYNFCLLIICVIRVHVAEHAVEVAAAKACHTSHGAEDGRIGTFPNETFFCVWVAARDRKLPMALKWRGGRV